MSGEDRRSCLARRGREEVERQPIGVFRALSQRQAKLQHRIEKAVLGKLDLSPMQQVFRSGEIGDSAIVPTRHAERVPMLDSYQPIADIVPGIGAEPIQPIRTSQ